MTAELRLRPSSKPIYMDAGARNWLIKTARKNYWRVASWLDIDDLIQDGYVCWHVVLTKYPEVDNPRILMRIFQVTYTNFLHDLANKRTATLEMPFCILSEEAVFRFEQQVCDFGQLLSLIIEAPPVVARCLQALVFNGLDLNAPYRTWLDGRRETFSERLQRLLRLEPASSDLYNAIRSYLTAR